MQTKIASLATSPPKSFALPESWIERLFARFSAMYGAKFADAWRGCNIADVKAVWGDALGGYSRDELAAGVAKCLQRDWPPTLPEFLKLCRPPIDYTAALLEAIEQMARRESGRDRWSHPAIFWAAAKVGAHDLASKTAKDLEPQWRKVFGEQLALGAWADIPARLTALPAPGQTHSRAVGVETIKQMMDRLKRSANEHVSAKESKC